MKTPATPDPVEKQPPPRPATPTRAEPRRKRSLSILDLLILVAALASGFALVRTLPEFLAIEDQRSMLTGVSMGQFGVNRSSRPLRTWDYLVQRSRASDLPLESRLSYWFGHLPFWSSPCLLLATLATVGLMRRGRGRRRRRATGSPGAVAALAVGLASLIQITRCFQAAAMNGGLSSSFSNGVDLLWDNFWVFLPKLAGLCVASAWIGPRVAGRRGERPDGPERLARILGWAWIASAISEEVAVWLFALRR